MRLSIGRARSSISGRRIAVGILVAGLILLVPIKVMLGRASGSSAFVRVNQLGYAPGTSMRAYVMASGPETGATFKVENSTGATVYSAAIGGDRGPWSASFPHVYALDFKGVATPGMYSISVSGPIAATSPSFKVNTGENLYSGALANALSFFQNERDGPAYLPSALRTAPAHLHDQSALTYLTPVVDDNGAFSGDLTSLQRRIDASGGWWDAGDYLKFVMTTSYAVDLQLLGIRDFSAAMGSQSTGADFSAEAQFGLDWLQKMWDDSTRTLYYQVGIGGGNARTISDHDIWRLPQVDDTYGGTDPQYRYIRNRPVFRAGAPGTSISPNLAGRDVAALALCFEVFRSSHPAYANRCLVSAEHIFDLANTHPSGNLLTAIPYSFYPEKEWRDDLELGATELYRALAAGNLPAGLPHSDSLYYLKKAAYWANAYIAGPNDAADTLNLYDVSGVAHYELYRSIARAGNPGGLDVTPAALLSDLKKQLDQAAAQGAKDPFGFGFPWNTFDTTTHGAGLAVMASEYAQLTGSNDYAALGDRWLGNILGANGWGTSLIVGDGSTFPHCMQHQVANLVGSTNGSPPILRGAVVEGPNSFAATGVVSGMVTCPPSAVDTFARFNNKAVFQDNVQSYSTVEPAIDLVAASPLAFARHMAQPGSGITR